MLCIHIWNADKNSTHLTNSDLYMKGEWLLMNEIIDISYYDNILGRCRYWHIIHTYRDMKQEGNIVYIKC